MATKYRILQTCVKLFLEKGYKKTTFADIIKNANVSASSYQQFFVAKDGILVELVEHMFSTQFGAARELTDGLSPVYVYAVETAIQLALTEQNENLREIYVEAYTKRSPSRVIFEATAKELQEIFAPYLPKLEADDFYRLEIGSAGIMRSYMAYPCCDVMSLDEKIRSFLMLTLRAYNVPQKEIKSILAYIAKLDMPAIAQKVVADLVRTMAKQFDFTLDGLGIEDEEK